jgi:hypothetical protein
VATVVIVEAVLRQETAILAIVVCAVVVLEGDMLAVAGAVFVERRSSLELGEIRLVVDGKRILCAVAGIVDPDRTVALADCMASLSACVAMFVTGENNNLSRQTKNKRRRCGHESLRSCNYRAANPCYYPSRLFRGEKYTRPM